MKGTRETYITCIVGDYSSPGNVREIQAGDAVIFSYQNGNSANTEHPVIIKALSDVTLGGKYCHGVAVNDAAVGEKVAVRLATAGTLCVKARWTSTLAPGTAVYPPATTDGLLETTGDAENILGMYVGADILPVSDSGSCIEVLIVRLSAVYVAP
jgi:hypothetical protein